MNNLKNIISGLIEIDTKQNAKLKAISGAISGLNYSLGGSGKYI